MQGHEEANIICLFNRHLIDSSDFCWRHSDFWDQREVLNLTRRSRWWARWRRHFLVWKRSNQGAQRERGGRLRRDVARRRAEPCTVFIASYLILFLELKTPAAVSRCYAGLQKFIRRALQAGYSCQKHTVFQRKRSWCPVATNAQPVSINLMLILLESEELSTCKHSLPRSSKMQQA